MEVEEFNAKYARISQDIDKLKQERRDLCQVMAEEHPINRLKGKLVKVNDWKPMYFDHLEIQSNYDFVTLAIVVGYTPKKDGSISKKICTHYVNVRTIEEEIVEVV